MKITVKRLALGFASAGILTIYGCGGGSSSSTTTSDVTTTTDVTTTFKGVAATGKALANATINITCAAGAEVTTSKPDGSYSVDIKNITLPCALKAASSDGTTVLYSVTSATATSSNTQVANITPLTQLLVASLAGTEPATFFSNFGASSASSVTDSAIGAAQTAVLSTLSNAGIDVSGLSSTNLVSGTLVAGSSSNAYDVALEALGAKLTDLAPTGTTLATLTTAVANTSTTTAPTSTATTSGTPSLPADMLLKTAASNCSALRSGSYRMVNPQSGSALADQTGLITIDAATAKFTYSDGTQETWTPNGTCRYTGANGKDDVVVSQAGVLVARYTDNGGLSYKLAIGFPAQTHALGDAAGAWNALGLNGGNPGLFAGIAVNSTIDAAGAMTATFCGDPTSVTWDTTTCQALPAGTLALTANSDGGFNVINNGQLGGRAFAYRAGGGELMVVEVDNDGSFTLLTKQRTNSLPTVGAVTTSWNLSLGSQLTSAIAVDANSNTIVSVDAAAGSWLRKQNTVGVNDGHLETFLANNPRAGYSFRAAGTALADNGTTASFREVTSLGLRGMGLNAVLVPSAKRFQISVNQP